MVLQSLNHTEKLLFTLALFYFSCLKFSLSPLVSCFSIQSCFAGKHSWGIKSHSVFPLKLLFFLCYPSVATFIHSSLIRSKVVEHLLSMLHGTKHLDEMNKTCIVKYYRVQWIKLYQLTRYVKLCNLGLCGRNN